MSPQGSEARRYSVSLAKAASKVVITGGVFTGVQQNHADSLEPFYSHVAPNAILNAGGRADNVRCYPGTRKEVIGIIEKWIDSDGDVPGRIFWLSGPAGAGKTAIIQTVAERCIQRGVPMANYFFFRTDSTRNHAGPLVATLLYQILELYPALKTNITTLLATKPLIFDQSIPDQFQYSLDVPVRTMVNNSAAHSKRLVLLVDGLDECSSETKHVQGDLLRALHHLSSQQGSPFLVLVASRAEPHLTMAFNEIGTSNESIFLGEEYCPSDDIRTFVVAEFNRIKRNHRLRDTLDNDWPPNASIDEIVEKSSGQFIYAATVMRFISGSSANPAHSLDRVRGVRAIGKNSPFAEVDAIYTHILSQAEEWDLAKDILAGQFILSAVTEAESMIGHSQKHTICALLAPLKLTQPEVESSLSDLVAVVQYDRDTEEVIFYHASLQDFFRDKSRSKTLNIDLESFKARLAAAHLLAMSSLYHLELFCSIFSLVEIATPSLRNALTSWKPWKPTLYSSAEDQQRMRIVGHRFVFALRKLFSKYDDPLYGDILRKWLSWTFDLKIPRRD